jgi:hypothetical protein
MVCTEFILLANLPAELRLKIWEMTLQPRIVEVEIDDDDDGDAFFSRTRLPVIREICQESRELYWNHYGPAFEDEISTPQIIVNYSLDTIYLPLKLGEKTELFFRYLSPDKRKSLRYLALDEDATAYVPEISEIQYFFGGLQTDVESLEGLRELIIVYRIDFYINDVLMQNVYFEWHEARWEWVPYWFEEIPKCMARFGLIHEPYVVPISRKVGPCEEVKEWDVAKKSGLLLWGGHLDLHILDGSGQRLALCQVEDSLDEAVYTSHVKGPIHRPGYDTEMEA